MTLQKMAEKLYFNIVIFEFNLRFQQCIPNLFQFIQNRQSNNLQFMLEESRQEVQTKPEAKKLAKQKDQVLQKHDQAANQQDEEQKEEEEKFKDLKKQEAERSKTMVNFFITYAIFGLLLTSKDNSACLSDSFVDVELKFGQWIDIVCYISIGILATYAFIYQPYIAIFQAMIQHENKKREQLLGQKSEQKNLFNSSQRPLQEQTEHQKQSQSCCQTKWHSLRFIFKLVMNISILCKTAWILLGLILTIKHINIDSCGQLPQAYFFSYFSILLNVYIGAFISAFTIYMHVLRKRAKIQTKNISQYQQTIDRALNFGNQDKNKVNQSQKKEKKQNQINLNGNNDKGQANQQKIKRLESQLDQILKILRK